MDDKAIIQASYEAALGKLFEAAFALYRTDDRSMDRFEEGYLLLLNVRERALAIIEDHTSASADSPA